MSDIILEFSRNGQPSGFAAEKGEEFIFKPDRYSACIVSTETLKQNLRKLVRTKEAKIIKAGTVEAVVVPSAKFESLFA